MQSDQTPADVRLGGFLVDMAKAFEDFLTAALTEALRPLGGWSRAQDHHHLDVDDLVAMRPDLVWCQRGDPAAVIDAKYKVEKPAGFSDADLYQMLAYQHATVQRDDEIASAFDRVIRRAGGLDGKTPRVPSSGVEIDL